MIRLTPTITLYNRGDWGARGWRDYVPQRLEGEAFLHHTTDRLAEHVDTLPEQIAACRAIQRYHMDMKGWDDIAYHFIVFQPYGDRQYARIFEGRPTTHVPAAQQGHNVGTLAIVVYGNFDHDDSVKRNTRHAIETLLSRYPQLKKLGGHRDAPGQSTECPGDTLYAKIPTIARAVGLKHF